MKQFFVLGSSFLVFVGLFVVTNCAAAAEPSTKNNKPCFSCRVNFKSYKYINSNCTVKCSIRSYSISFEW